MENNVVIQGRGICKDFSGVRVLFDVDIDGRIGEVHGLVGENGAGKSTLMNILGGVLHPTEGRIFFRGKEVALNPKLARSLGIVLVPQELNLVESLSIYENVFLGSETKRVFFLDRNAMIDVCEQALRSVGLETVDPRTPVEKLSTAQKQLVEITRAVLQKIHVLILDEPTATLTEHEIAVLFRVIRSLKEQGVSIFYVSHRLREVKEICDRVTVLRDGKVVTSCAVEEVGEAEIARLMVGRPFNTIFPPKDTKRSEVVLEVNGLTTSDGRVKGVGFTLRRGEVLGFAGLVGSGRTEMAEAIFGTRKRLAGEILFKGHRVTIASPWEAKRLGIVYLPEERKSSGLLTSMSVRENVSLMVLDRIARLLLRRREERNLVQRDVERLRIRCQSIEQPVDSLSGGNQQKVIFARLMETQPEIYLLDEPTRGIDVGTKHYMYQLIRDLAREGLSFVVISSDLPEVVGLCDRVVVMRDGKLVATLEDEEVNEEEIILYATGIREREGV
ncbi:MAG: sugar ABC transporter ATP-binding protein [Atribacterota bacterium]